MSAILFSSCYVTKTKSAMSYDIYGNGVIQKPVICDLEVRESKVSGTSITHSSINESARQFAIADALEKANADVLIEPRFSSETRNGRTEITVTGFPAVYKNFRPVVASDSTLVRIGEKQIARPAAPVETKNNLNKAAAAVAALVALAGTFLFGIFLTSI